MLIGDEQVRGWAGSQPLTASQKMGENMHVYFFKVKDAQGKPLSRAAHPGGFSLAHAKASFS